MKNLFLFSNNYPYGCGETFLADELPYLAEKFDRVFVVPLWGSGEKRCSDCPNIISLDPILDFSPKQKAKLIKNGLLNLSSVPDLFREIVSGKGKLAKRIWITVTSTLVIRCILSNGKFRELVERICDGDVCYFYWGDMTANVLPFLKKYNRSQFRSIVRFHGSDLYVDAKGYIPFRKQLLEALDVACVISKNGFNYLNNKYSIAHDKLILCRLGSRDLGMEKVSKCDEFRILTCSNIVELKRLDLLAEALKLIGDKKVRWTHIGDGVLKSQLVELVDSLPNNIRVVFKGQMKHNDLLDFLKESCFDVFVNVSRSEGVPVSIMEAMSFGIPVIATDVGGTSEIVSNDTGILIPKNVFPEQLKDVVLEFAGFDDEKVSKMRKAARAEWGKNWNMDSNYTDFANFISDC